MLSLKALLTSISWNYVQAGVSLAIFFLLTPFVVEQLGSVGYGIWVLLNAILFYLRFLDLGFYNALVKYVAEYSERQAWSTVNGLVATTASALSAAGVVALLASGLVAWLLVPSVFEVPPERIPELQVATVLIGVDLLIAFPTSVLDAIFEGRQRFDVLSGVNIVVSVLAAGATVAGLLAGYGLVMLVWIEIGATVASAVISFWLLRRLFPEIGITFGPLRGPSLQRIRGYSTWTSLNEALVEGGAQLEKVLVPILLSVALLTPYSLICSVAAAIFLAIEPITDVFFPLSSAYDASDDKQRLRDLLLRGTKLVMAISLPLAVGIVAYGEDFILLWIGEEHVDLPPNVMPLVVLSFATTAFVLTSTTILLAMGRVREVFSMTVAELVSAVVLILLSVPRFELVGLAGSLLLANVAITFFWVVPFVCWLLGQPVRVFLGQSLLRPLLAVLPMGMFIAWLDRYLVNDTLWALLIPAVLASGVYLVAFCALSLTPPERDLCFSSVRSLLTRKAE
jgi:O-antigen/teichoic acid export membrane protein